MNVCAYEFDTNTGKITPVYGGAGAVEKVVFLSVNRFNLTWSGPQMSGSAKATGTYVTIDKTIYRYGWFAICREPVYGVTFTLSNGVSKTQQVDFSGLGTWNPKEQRQGLDCLLYTS